MGRDQSVGITRRLGPWRFLLLAGLVIAAIQAGLDPTANVVVTAVVRFAGSAAWGQPSPSLVSRWL